MLCLIHGYGLTGSGSNLWTRSAVQALCATGEDVHLVCQEPHPERYDFIAEAYHYAADGTTDQFFVRSTPYEGRCFLHRPQLDILPVYVQPRGNSETMACILDMDDAAVEAYVQRNETILRQIVDRHPIDAMHVNHVVLMSVAAQRVRVQRDVPFAVMPHGSAIEYIVKRDPRMHRLATRALTECRHIITQSEEMQRRVLDVFPTVPRAQEKMIPLNLGVNTRQFRPLSRAERPASIDRLKQALAGSARGKTAGHIQRTRNLPSDPTLLHQHLQAITDYPARRPDANLEAQLDAIDWPHENILIFVGRLLASKGLPSLIAALPSILAEAPGTRLLVVGRGPLREPMEAFVAALGQGHRPFVQYLAERGDGSKPFLRVQRYLARLESTNRLDTYFEHAARLLTPDRVVFTGYLDHALLRHLLPCCDVGVFPSVVAEAGPLTFLEAMACGCFPVGTYYAGMKGKIDTATEALPREVAACMKLRRDPDHTVADIATHVPRALTYASQHKKALRAVAEEHYAWHTIARTLVHKLHGSASQAA